jgi:hypothetical protein
MAEGPAGRTAGDYHVGSRLFAPAYEDWLEAVRRVRPDLSSGFNPWDRITTPEEPRPLGGAALHSVIVLSRVQA